MNNTTPFPPSREETVKSISAAPRESEITVVMHELRNQACTLGLGIATLKYPEESEDMRQRHLAALEAVIHEMNRHFQLLDNWLVRAGHKRGPRMARSAGLGEENKKRTGRADKPARVRVVRFHERRSRLAAASDDDTR